MKARVEDIMTPTRRDVHALTSFATVRGATITYPAQNSEKMALIKHAQRESSQQIFPI